MKTLLTSRKFWVALLVLVTVIVSAFIPAFEMDTEQAAGYAIIAVSYLVGVAVDPGPGGWKGVLQSRKFWAAVVGFLVLTLQAFKIVLPFDLTPEQLIAFCVVLGGYITGVALEKPIIIPVLKATVLKKPIKS